MGHKRSRTRRRSSWTGVTSTGYNQYCVKGVWHDYHPVEFQLIGADEMMFDFVGNRGKENPCKHIDLKVDLPGIPSGYTWTDWYPNRVVHPRPVPLSFGDWNAIKQLVGTVSVSSERFIDFCDESFFALTTQVPVNVDGPMLLLDVIELKGLARSIGTAAQRTAAILRKIISLKLPVNAIRRLIADEYLAYKFGFESTLRDITQLYERFQSLGNRLKFLRDTAGKVYVTHRSSNYKFTDKVNYKSVAVSGPHTFHRRWYLTPGYNAHMSMTLRIKNDLRGLDEAYADQRALMAELGFNRPLSVVWELVPFSFVVDWVFKVQRWLDRYADIDPFNGQLTCVGASCSIKTTWNGVFTGCLDVEDGASEVECGTLKGSTYHRMKRIPLSQSVLTSSGLTPSQTLILAALINQRW